MKNVRFLETITTKYFLLLIIILSFSIIAAYVVILIKGMIDIDTLSKSVDSIFKTIAVLVGAICAINRYYTSRTDESKFRVDADVSLIQESEFDNNNSELGLLVYRLDIVNTGFTLIPIFDHFLIIDAIYPSTNDNYSTRRIHRWPEEPLTHEGGPIEPKSWVAINDAISVQADVRVVRLYLELIFKDNEMWNWHKTINLSV